MGESAPDADLIGFKVGMPDIDSALECREILDGDSDVLTDPECSDVLRTTTVLEGSERFSFCLDARKASATLGLMGIFEGCAALGLVGLVLNFPEVCFVLCRGWNGSSSSRVAAAIRLFKSDSELRLFFFRFFEGVRSVAGPGSPIVSSGKSIRCELVGLWGVSSNAPAIGGLSRDMALRCKRFGKLLSSIDLALSKVPRDKLDVSPVAGFRCLLKVRQTDGRSSLEFCRRRASSPNLRRSDDALDVIEPV